MEISLTIKEILPLLENKVNALHKGIEERKVALDKQLTNLKEYVKDVDNAIAEARRINYQELIQDFTYVKKISDTKSKWLFFKEDYTKEEEHLNTYKLESYIQKTFYLRVDVVNVSREGHKNYKMYIIKLGGFHFKGDYYSVYYEKDRHYLKAGKMTLYSESCGYTVDNTIRSISTSLEEVLSLKKKLSHFQSLFGEDKIITLNERQIQLIGK